MDECWVEVKLENIGWNLRMVRRVTGGAKVIAVIKANAYGHGLVPVAEYLQDKADMLAVARLEEAITLREAGIAAPILNLFPILPDEVEPVVDYDIIQSIDDMETCLELSRCAKDRGKEVRIHLKVDTGMARTGVWYTDAIEFASRLMTFQNLKIDGVFTHFSSADDPNTGFTMMQLNRFQSVLEGLNVRGIRPPIVHAANSAAILSFPEMRFPAVRPGLMLYGVYPSSHLEDRLDLKPALTWKTRVIGLKRLDIHQPVGYGCAYKTLRPSLIATLRVGYGDGYRWHLSNCGKVLINGRESPIVGRICMDTLMCDVTDIPGVKLGDEAVLIGGDEVREISPMYLAKLAGTIPYDILAGIGGRVKRVYVG
jgi:alanine racemase